MIQWLVHRDGRWFDAPEAFRPERWDNDLVKRLPRFAYFPFGGGPRICIGNHFALMEAVLILATIAQQYRLEREPGQAPRVAPSVTLRPRRSPLMRLEPRTAGRSPRSRRRRAEPRAADRAGSSLNTCVNPPAPRALRKPTSGVPRPIVLIGPIRPIGPMRCGTPRVFARRGGVGPVSRASSFPRSTWERPSWTLRVSSLAVGWDAERPGILPPRRAWEQGKGKEPASGVPPAIDTASRAPLAGAF